MNHTDQTGQRSIYQINDDGEITYVNEVWDAFARANEGAHVVGARVVGTVLWDHISDPVTREIYRMVVDRARRRGRPHQFPFRCDGPTMIRHMTMCVERVGADRCQFTAVIDRLEPRPAVPLLDSQAPRARRWLRICSWCKKVAMPGDRWVEVEVAMAEQETFVAAELPVLTHSICPVCQGEVAAGLPPPDPA